ncbi:SpoIIE family protein phosphatase [Streptomyces sp. JJ36]|uniref:SpoIIE family protein phosphatase n=1 Tax=Streptomyces sp. JJ36 TaxID=2736645 RepID=UPI001F009238|nr:SpoIIE family protein phosphatase [Streptomyces sp. JJ36]MCF6521976.1 SpoIIE family protein phosphatase [Streptomyces sp. JJ36]
MAETSEPAGAAADGRARARARLDGGGPAGDTAPSALLDVLDLGVVLLDLRGRILLWSPSAEEILGWPPGDVTGRRLETLLLPEDETPSEQAWRLHDALRAERRWHGVLRARHRAGHPVQVETRAFLLSDRHGFSYVLASVAEAGRLRAVDQDLAALEALFSSNALGLALFDTELRYVRINEALARLNGLPVHEHLGKTVFDTLPRSMAEEIYRCQQKVLRTGRSLIDVLTAPDGYGSRSVAYGRLTDEAGRPLGVSCAVMDITERRDALDKVERSRQRLALLDHVGVALGDRLDVRRISQALATALVPRFSDYSGVMLLGAVAYGGELPGDKVLSGTPLLQLGVAAKDRGPAVRRMLRVGQDIAFETGSFFGQTLATGEPHLIVTQEELRAATYPGDPKVQAALDLGIHSLMVVPLRARGIVLGLLVISRAAGRDPFDRDDLALLTEIADRAGTSLDNARLYAREREGALMLQRSLLPQQVPSPTGVRVAYRYVPGSSGAEVGGDWFDVIPLAGGRVAFVVGDVTGHGLRAAATMGRLRTAVRTLAGLDLPPDELLRRVNDLADDLAPGPDDPLLATVVYAVYDPSTGRCALARAGHVPPLLITPRAHEGRRARPLETPSGAPLGVGGVSFEAVELDVPEGSVLVLYTDGLIENRGEDITDGVDRLCAVLERETHGALEEACDAALTTLSPQDGGGEGTGSDGGDGDDGDGGDGAGAADTVELAAGHPAPLEPADDAALLMAQLGGLPEGSAASWTFSAESYAVRRARAAVRDALREWGLTPLADTTELLVSELVTNSLRYAHGPIGVRMVRGSSLLVEVSDPLPEPPRARIATEEDEGGRGIQLVARESRRWGTRHGPMGKTVWFELALPG